LVGLVKGYPEYRSEEVYKATKGLVTDKWALIDFIIGNEYDAIEETKYYFIEKYGCSVFDMLSDTNGDFEKLLKRATKTKRTEGIEEDKVNVDMNDIFKETQSKGGDLSEVLIEILTKRSYEHLKICFKEIST